ncbi:DUF445 domain-containing protein [Polluticoccus soli]|uniref:DUF445 domain-containing protein n=1 Tax=Polluticoccus soli TaxID=3034150 RepID=UPI0023E17640|nr:DUF445 family protein [Flavipsychrobacter sp. JY13-12]
MIPLIIIPIISAFIGWFTNWIAIKMLFHPKQPKKILGITFHGIFPKRQRQFAEKLGVLVATELLHFDEIAVRLKDPGQLKELEPVISKHLDTFLQVKLKEKLPVISMFVGEGTMGKIKEGMMEEIEVLLPEIIERYTDSLSHKVDVQRMVTEKVSNFSSDKLENILNAIMKKEFFFVEIIGGVLGFIIGLLQVLLTLIS